MPLVEVVALTYTFEDLTFAWWVGYEYALAPERVAELADDIRHAPTVPPTRPYEQRVAERHAQMLEFAQGSGSTWRGRYPGGPVDWETGRVLVRSSASRSSGRDAVGTKEHEPPVLLRAAVGAA